MRSEQLVNELHTLLSLLNQQIDKFQVSHEKLQVALAGVFRIMNDDSPLLANLQGDPAHLKSYVIRLSSDLSESTMHSYDSLRKKIEDLIDTASRDRKS
jgi:hypothetical protein